MKKLFAILMTVAGLNSACSQGFQNADATEFAKLIANPGVVILDVRTPREFAEAHIKGAMLIDWHEPDFMQQARKRLPKDKHIAIYCRSGRRSAEAAALLSKEGYRLTNLRGGIIEWNENHLPIIIKQ